MLWLYKCIMRISKMWILKNSDDLDYIVNNNVFTRTIFIEFFTVNKISKKKISNYCIEKCHRIMFRINNQYIWLRENNVLLLEDLLVLVFWMVKDIVWECLLLNHVRGPTSFTDFRFVNGVQCLSYHESTLLHGLLDVEDYVEMWIALDIM